MHHLSRDKRIVMRKVDVAYYRELLGDGASSSPSPFNIRVKAFGRILQIFCKVVSNYGMWDSPDEAGATICGIAEIHHHIKRGDDPNVVGKLSRDSVGALLLTISALRQIREGEMLTIVDTTLVE